MMFCTNLFCLRRLQTKSFIVVATSTEAGCITCNVSLYPVKKALISTLIFDSTSETAVVNCGQCPAGMVGLELEFCEGEGTAQQRNNKIENL